MNTLSPLGLRARELKSEIKNLDEVRSSLSAKLSSVLPLSFQNESLIDQDGFPRSDIDLYAVRGARQQVSCLSNDLRDVNRKLDQTLQNLHALGQEAIAEAIQAERSERISASAQTSPPQLPPPSSSEVSVAHQSQTQNGVPFAEIDAISPDSPAWECGLRRGDRILQIGEATSMSSVTSEVSRFVQNDVTQQQRIPLKVKLLREGYIMLETDLYPRRWSGQGVLGCHIIPFNNVSTSR